MQKKYLLLIIVAAILLISIITSIVFGGAINSVNSELNNLENTYSQTTNVWKTSHIKLDRSLTTLTVTLITDIDYDYLDAYQNYTANNKRKMYQIALNNKSQYEYELKNVEAGSFYYGDNKLKLTLYDINEVNNTNVIYKKTFKVNLYDLLGEKLNFIVPDDVIFPQAIYKKAYNLKNAYIQDDIKSKSNLLNQKTTNKYDNCQLGDLFGDDVETIIYKSFNISYHSNDYSPEQIKDYVNICLSEGVNSQEELDCCLSFKL